MEKRFTTVTQSSRPIDWNETFDELHKMTGRQTEWQCMSNRTFLRPRDMIKFCNETLTAYKLCMDGAATFESKHILATNLIIRTIYIESLRMKFTNRFRTMNFMSKF